MLPLWCTPDCCLFYAAIVVHALGLFKEKDRNATGTGPTHNCCLRSLIDRS